MQNRRGCFITLEGLDGAGKSTHVQWLVDEIRGRGLTVVATREPGGTALGEALRAMMLEQPMHLKTETLLMFAARCEHIEQIIEPALARGDWVVCDRYTDASYAYQGGGRGLGSEPIRALEQWVHPGLQPDRTWLFDVPLDVARGRLAGMREPDRFERENGAFFERTRQAYHARARECPQRIRIVDSTRPIEEVRRELAGDLQGLLQAWQDIGRARPPGRPPARS